MNRPVRVGLIGSQFISTIHAEALKTVSDAEILAVVPRKQRSNPPTKAKSPLPIVQNTSGASLIGGLATTSISPLAKSSIAFAPGCTASVKTATVYWRFADHLQMHLDCGVICKGGGGSKGCRIRECCQDKGIQGCWSCDQCETCEILSRLNPVHGDAHRKNIRIIRRKGVQEFLAGEKHW